MSLSTRAQALVLLTVPLSRGEHNSPQPLTIAEWKRLASWMSRQSINPEDLLRGTRRDLLIDLCDKTVTPDRVRRLLDRGLALGLALEKWERAGIWVLTYDDPEYPDQLKKRFGVHSSPVLFGCGSKSLLKTDGIAVVGSREASSRDCEKAYQYGKLASDEGYSLVSGGARGIDTCAANGALDTEGTVTVVLANGLLRASTSAKYRDHLMSKNLLILSENNPESTFNVGYAMARNRYIYGLSSSAIVVCCTRNKGGTWNGAVENIKNQWVPLWVCSKESEQSGNESLVNRGGRWLPDPLMSIASLLEHSEDDQVELNFDHSGSDGLAVTENKMTSIPLIEGSLYRVFLDELSRITSIEPLSRDDISSKLFLRRSQTEDWLKRGVACGEIKKSIRPVRYQVVQDLFASKSYE